MSAVLRFTFSKLLNNSKNLQGVVLHNLNYDGNSVRSIASRATRIPIRSKQGPWPYEEKSFNILHYFTDKTSHRMDENSKIVVVEGPVASGKSKFAKHLAAELEMLYLPEANHEMTYINDYGYDMRKLDPELPEGMRSFSITDWLKNPRHYKAIKLQLEHYELRYSQYIDALAHLLSTGQGVVLDRSVHSDFVFLEAMYSQKFISRPGYDLYYDFRKNSIFELLRPHLVIYLDVPVKQTLENINKRGIPAEVNSGAMNEAYLTVMEHNYKQKYLKEISKHAELLVYDWSEGGDYEVVVEDVEKIDFGKYEGIHDRMGDWVFRLEEEWAVARYKYTEKKDELLAYLNIPCHNVPELMVDGEEYLDYLKVWHSAPGMKFDTGYNKDMGDKFLLFKNKKGNRRGTLPRIEKKFP